MADEDIMIEVDIEGGPSESPKTAADAAENLKRGINERSKTEEGALAAAAESERRLNDERAARQRAEEELRQSREKVTQAEKTSIDSDYNSVANALTAAEELGKSLVSEKARLMKEGDFDKACELDMKIAETGASITNLRAGKVQLEDAKKKAAEKKPDETRPRQTEMEVQDSWLSSIDSHNAAWIRANRTRYFSDKDFQKKAAAASQEALAFHNLKTSDPGYIDFIETKLGMREAKPIEGDATSDAGRSTARQSEQQQQAPRLAAPPSRQTPTSEAGMSRQRITLTAEEASIARQTLTPEILGKNPDGTPRDPLKVFAQRKAELIRDGRVFRNA